MFSNLLPSIVDLHAAPQLALHFHTSLWVLLLLRLALATYLVRNARTVWSSAPLLSKWDNSQKP